MRLEPEGPVYSFFQRAAALAKLNLLYLLCALPVVTAGASAAALAAGLDAWRQGQEATAAAFFRAFAAHGRRATVLWLGMLALGAGLTADYVLLAPLDFPGKLLAVGAVLFAAFTLSLAAPAVFPLLVRTGGGAGETAAQAVLLAWGRLPRMAAAAAGGLLPLALFLALPPLFWLTGWFWLLWGFAALKLWQLWVLAPLLPPAGESPPETGA